MAARMRAFDWARTPLGESGSWPQSLRSTVSLLLASRAQIILFWGSEFVVLYNDAYRPVFGGKHPHVLGKAGREAWREIWDTQLGPLLQGVVRSGEAFGASDLLFVLERHGFAEETYFDISYDPVRVESGEVGGVFCIVTETTERVVGERRLALLRDLAANNATGRTDRDACSLTIQTLEGRADIAFALAILDDFQIGTSEASERLARVRPELVQTLPFSTTTGPAGRLIVGLNERLPFDAGYRSFLRLVVDQLSTAVSNARAYEEERRRADALAEIDRAKTMFFNNVSHELRTPLSLLLGPLEDELSEREALPESRLAGLQIAHRNALRLLRLVNTLLDFSRTEAGRVDAAFQATDLASLTADVASAFRSVIEKAGLRFSVDCPPLDEPVYVDRDMWEKVVLNLLSNAFKFTLQGEIRVSLRSQDDVVELSVLDTGVGIAEADLPRIFERFHRVRQTQARTNEGTGIGLAFVKELARLHGGTAQARSSLGVGSTFSVTVRRGTSHLPADRILESPVTSTNVSATPYVQEALRWLPGSPGADTSPRVAEANAPRILIADDNADMRDYLSRIIGQRYRVDVVSNGAVAYERIVADAPDLVLSDVMMPTLDGFGLVAAIRGTSKTRGIPVILLSARAGEEARVDGLAAGADEYLVKPFSARELLASIASHLELSRVRREAERERKREEAERIRLIEENANVTETLNRVGALVVSDLDRSKVVQAVTDAATESTGAEFGAFFYNVLDERGEAYTLYTISGAPREAFSKFPMPRNTAIFEPTFKGTGVMRSDDITREPQYGHNAPYHGMPEGHLPVRSYLAAPVRGRNGQVIGGLFFGHSQVGRFSAHHERIAVGIAAWAALALENSYLFESEQAAGRLKDEFLASLSHELRTPLNAIVGYSRMLQSGAIGPDKRGKAVDTIVRNAMSLNQIVEDVLDVSRIVSGKLRLNVQRVDVPLLVRNAMEAVLPAAESKGLSIEAALDPELPTISADPERLQQVLWNLLSNAVKFTPRGGSVRVSLERLNERVLLTVTDTGIGIEAEFLPKIFERFRQAEGGITRERGGLGLGLAIARQLTEMHGGTIEAFSAGLGKGAEFRLTLPAAALPPPEVSQPSRATPSVAFDAAAGNALKGIHVLAVDDEPDALALITHVLEVAGARVTTASSAEEALSKLSLPELPDVIVSDLGMPLMDGFQLIERVRQHSDTRLRQTPAAAVTAYARSEDRMKALKAGFQIHIAKPIDVAEVVTTVAALAKRVVGHNPESQS